MTRLPAFRTRLLLLLLPLLLTSFAAGAEDPPTLLDRFDRPPLISASLKDLPAGKALQLLCLKAGCPAIDADRGGTPVTLELKEVPFWEAVDRVAAAAGMVLTGSQFPAEGDTGSRLGVREQLRLALPDDRLLAASPCNRGPVRVALVAVVVERSGKVVARFSEEAETGDPGRETLRVDLRFHPLAGLEDAELGALLMDAAVDEKGLEYASHECEVTKSYVGSMAPPGWTGSANFDASGGTGERLTEISGALEVFFPGAEESVELDLASLPATAKIGGATFTVVEVGDASMKATVEGSLLTGENGRPPLPQILSGEEGELPRVLRPKPDGLRILLRDAAGKVVTSASWSGGGGDVLTYDFELSGRPVKATVSGRTKVEKREVPFRFKDIPLPR